MSGSEEEQDGHIFRNRRKQLSKKLNNMHKLNDGHIEDIHDESTTFLGGEKTSDKNPEESMKALIKEVKQNEISIIEDEAEEIEVLGVKKNKPKRARITRKKPTVQTPKNQEVFRILDEAAQRVKNEPMLSPRSSQTDTYVKKDDQSFEEVIDIKVKVKYMGLIKRVNMKTDDKFYFVIPEICKLFKILDSKKLTLTLNNAIISLDQTPLSLKLSVVDILDCYIKNDVNDKHKVADPNLITLKVVDSNIAQNSRSTMCKSTDIKINKTDTVSVLMNKYSQLIKVPLEKLIFVFDGDILHGDETCIDLDLEDQCQVDCKIKKH